ncbi:MAG: hypothetical protein HN337_05350 [Deltaproteobacteria bacterium]|jgi:adenosylhomocysteine nucleosidase|nr:hypothetical protein [Deltaproteobacteria bacterium]
MSQYPLALVAALDDEIRIVKSRMEVDSKIHIRPSQIVIGKYNGKSIITLRSGIGRAAMANAISYLIENYHPDFCLHVGYCGGTDPRFAAGDVIIADAIVNAKDGAKLNPDAASVERAIKLCNEKGIRAKVGSVVTVEKAVCSPHEKAFVGTKHAVVGIDMESFELARSCDSNSVPYLVARAVFDPLDMDLPDLTDNLDKTGELDGMMLAEDLIKNPKKMMKLPKLQYCAAQARQTLTSFVDAWQEGVE